MYSNERVKVKSRESSTLTISRIYIHMYILKNSDDAISRYFHPDLERIGTVFRFPLLRQDRERESSRLRRRKMQKKKRRGKKCSVSGTIGRTCEFRGSEEASRGWKFRIATYLRLINQPRFNDHVVARFVVKARTCVTIDGFSPTTN